MHIVGGFDSALDFGNLFVALDAALLYAGMNEVHGGIFAHGVEFDAEQLAHLACIVGAVGWEVVDIASLADGFGAEGLQGAEVAAILDTYAGSEVLYRWQWAGPDNIVDIVVVGKEVVLAIVAVEYAYEVFALQAEEVEECRVLTEPVGVVWVVAGGFVVTLDDDKAVANILAELLAASNIGFFAKHNVLSIYY